MIVALAGGVGAARMLVALSSAVPPAELTAVVNTGDDVVMHGLRISPDLDTVTYTLAGAINPETGWGLSGETWQAMAELRRLSGDRLGWFNLGDRDLGTHLYRTTRLAEGATLSEVAGELARRWDVGVRILPMSDDRVETRVTLTDGEEIGFQEYFVGRRHSVPVASVRFAGVAESRPAPGVLEAIAGAERIVICPSNPLVSIGPVLAVPGLADAVAARRPRVVAVSPIIAGRALKGPADRLLAELGHEPTVVGVARMWARWAGTLVVDEADAALAPAVEETGVRCVVAPTIMSSPAASAALGRLVAGIDLDPAPTPAPAA
ncbi:MAG TPA: 2-phospho-L-lactate transferase [Acidimicrobiales bacterium]|nr:2-phospho-L-lactate transferase [Acidimicrobiales bacterium]